MGSLKGFNGPLPQRNYKFCLTIKYDSFYIGSMQNQWDPYRLYIDTTKILHRLYIDTARNLHRLYVQNAKILYIYIFFFKCGIQRRCVIVSTLILCRTCRLYIDPIQILQRFQSTSILCRYYEDSAQTLHNKQSLYRESTFLRWFYVEPTGSIWTV